MILFIAPYDGRAPEKSPFIAAAKKMQFLLGVLKSIDSNLVLLNSFPQNDSIIGDRLDAIEIGNGDTIERFTPSIKRLNWIGRLKLLLDEESIIERLVAQYGVPDLVWLYNGYAFESRAARILKKKYKAKVILEFEDWHFARSRGFSPKPFIDWFFWWKSLRFLDYGFAVNEFLLNKFTENGLPGNLLPGIIPSGINSLRELSPPFTNKETIRVGYFGGLSREKGVGFLLDLMPLTTENVTFVVTGSGELAGDLIRFKDTFPEKLEFFGTVNDDQLHNAFGSVDLIINAHEINHGIFPFKVLEAIASGRLLISTYLNIDSFKWLKDTIEFRRLAVEDFANAIHQSHDIYKVKFSAITKAARTAEQLFSHEALKTRIMDLIGRDFE